MLFGFFLGYLRQIPLSPIGDLKNPSGTLAGPRVSAPAIARRFAPRSCLRYGPRGFSNPLMASEDLYEDPLGKTRISYIYFHSENKTRFNLKLIRH